ncbi:MAG TPA: PQQ-binding-like beta-propeller repeat protein [Acidimicrobiales bacterium]|nr:PQQ-binding-like beta-propeller repeat protein [Acidimicrobiales bacterium]
MRLVRTIAIGITLVFVALVTAAFALQRSSPGPRVHPVVAAPAIHPAIEERWRVPIDGHIVGLPATDQAGVVVTAGESQVLAVSREGTVDWRAALPGALADAPRLDGDAVFVAAARAVAAFARSDGRRLWSVATTASDDENRANRPAVVGDTVVVTTAEGLALGLDRSTGAERWRTVLPTAITSEPAAGATADGDPVVVVVGVGEWWGIDPMTGTTLWSGDLGVYGTSSPVVYPEGLDLVAAVASNEQMLAVDAHTGAPRWSSPAAQSELFQVPVIADNGNELLVADHWGRLRAYSPDDGHRTWAVKGADTAAEFGAPVWLSDQFVALPLDGHGPRLASPRGAFRLRPPADGWGVADLPGAGLVVTTAGDKGPNYVLLYSVRYH